MKRHAYFVIILFAGACFPALSMAQPREQSSDFEPNSYVLDQLDAIYGASDKNRVESENLLLEQKPEPQRRPTTRTRSEASTRIITKITPYDPVKAPLPRRRPTIFHASNSFIKQARNSFGIKTDIPTASNVTKTTTRKKIPIRQAIVRKTNPLPTMQTHDPLGKTLVNPSVTDILAQIEPAAGNAKIDFTPPKPKPFIPTKNNTISLGYIAAITTLPDAIKPSLKEKALNKIVGSKDMRIEIMAYAESPDKTPSAAGDIALKRAQELQDFLVSSGIDEQLISLHPLGDSVKIIPQNRVDIRFVQ